ncbi:MAG TPA: hypothetical protein PKG52_00465 [bacterium]|nr:hypothetical protein [bacterium]HPS29011.1 hypothetical protein [bacterium]
MEIWKLLSGKIIKTINSGKLPQTIIFYGPSTQSAKDEFVYQISKLLVNPKRELDDKKFKELCETQSYSDFIVISKGSTGSIKIEDIHSLDDILCFSPFESENRIIYIRDASAMTIPAQNALLKKIEEPPAKTYFFLCTAKKNSLLPTICSRSISFFLPEEINSDLLTPYDFFPFIKESFPDIDEKFFTAEMKKIEIICLKANFSSISFIEKLYDEISDFGSLELHIVNNEINNEKFEYLKKTVIRARLAFLSFFIKNTEPDVSMRIADFLFNQQYFSLDASLFYNLLGVNFGKK